MVLWFVANFTLSRLTYFHWRWFQYSKYIGIYSFHKIRVGISEWAVVVFFHFQREVGQQMTNNYDRISVNWSHIIAQAGFNQRAFHVGFVVKKHWNALVVPANWSITVPVACDRPDQPVRYLHLGPQLRLNLWLGTYMTSEFIYHCNSSAVSGQKRLLYKMNWEEEVVGQPFCIKWNTKWRSSHEVKPSAIGLLIDISQPRRCGEKRN